MKKSKQFAFILSFGILFACGGGEAFTASDSETEANTEQTSDVELSNMEAHDLSAYDVPASIYLPTNQGTPELAATEWGSVEIRIGDSFGMEIVPLGISITEKKEELDGDLMYSIEYLEESGSAMVYKKTIADSDVAPEHHFFMTVELEGEIYELKSLAELSLKESQMKKVYTSAQSFKGN